jgi:hypothetical protein
LAFRNRAGHLPTFRFLMVRRMPRKS